MAPEILAPILTALGFLSPFAASGFAAYSYARHRRARPDQRRRFPMLLYLALALGSAVVAFFIGLSFGVTLACSSASAGNLCGLWGFFVTGPVAASLGIVLVGGMLMLLPADVSPVPRGTNVFAIFGRLWRGQYSLA